MLVTKLAAAGAAIAPRLDTAEREAATDVGTEPAVLAVAAQAVWYPTRELVCHLHHCGLAWAGRDAYGALYEDGSQAASLFLPQFKDGIGQQVPETLSLYVQHVCVRVWVSVGRYVLHVHLL